jgi:hypothetical protein
MSGQVCICLSATLATALSKSLNTCLRIGTIGTTEVTPMLPTVYNEVTQQQLLGECHHATWALPPKVQTKRKHTLAVRAGCK